MNELDNYRKTSTYIRESFGLAWLEGPYNDIDIVWSNDPVSHTNTQYWLQFLINEGDVQVITTGADPMHRYFGIISIQIFATKKNKDEDARDIGDFIGRTFKEIKHAQLHFKPATFKDIGEDDEWYQFNVAIEFYRDSLGALNL